MATKIIRQSRADIQLPDGGGRLEAQWIGPGPEAAPTLIFLHEGLGCVALWRDVPLRMAQATGCGVLVYSRLGYGASDACPLPRSIDFMHHEALVVLPEVVERSGIRDYLLVGHSDGGSIALIHAGGKSTQGLAGIVTLAAHVFCEELTRQSIEAARRRYLSSGLRARLSVYHGANTDCAFWGWNDVWLHPDFMRWNIEPYLPVIRVPVLAIQGENDPYGTSAQIQTIRDKTGGAVTAVMIPGCGHAPHLEQPEAVIPRIAEFVVGLFPGRER